MSTTFSSQQRTARNLLIGVIKNPFAWPGGYERLIVTSDGALLCQECVQKEARRIMGDIRDGYNTGWMPEGTCYEAVSAECAREVSEDLVCRCDHCSREFGELC